MNNTKVGAGSSTSAKLGVTTSAPQADEIIELLKKLKEYGNAPEQAERKIAELDKVVSALRKNRAIIAEQITQDTQTLAELKQKESAADKAVKELQTANNERKRTKQTILKALAHTEKEVAAFLGSAHSTTVKTIHNYTANTSAYVSRTLEAERGYSSKPGSTAGHIVSSGGTSAHHHHPATK